MAVNRSDWLLIEIVNGKIEFQFQISRFEPSFHFQFIPSFHFTIKYKSIELHCERGKIIQIS